MSLESSLYSTLSPICPRVFPDIAPATTATPYITWQQVGGSSFVYTEGALPNKRNARIQINVWADSRMTANSICMQIEETLCASPLFTAEPAGALLAAVDDDTDLRGSMQDFYIWADR